MSYFDVNMYVVEILVLFGVVYDIVLVLFLFFVVFDNLFVK